MRKVIAMLVMIGLVSALYAGNLFVSSKDITIQAEKGINPGSVTVAIGNRSASATSTVTITSSASWAVPNISSAVLNPLSSSNVSIAINSKSLAIGNYTATLTFSNASEGVIGTVVISLINGVAARDLHARDARLDHRETAVDTSIYTPRYVGDLLIFTASNKVFISKGITSSDWIELK